MQPILVTGGAGYIGSHTAKWLAQNGCLPVVLDNLDQGHRDFVRFGPLVEANIADRASVIRAVHEYGIEAVIHFAANAYVGESIHNPRRYFQNNVFNTARLIDALLDAGVRNFVFSSSCAVYGNPVDLPVRESHPTNPLSPYGDSKLFVERMLRWYGEAYGLKWVALRYFNAAGADPEGDLGEDHDPETHLVPLLMDAALGERTHVDVFGADYPTPDGTAIRDFVHVQDLATAHMAALRYLDAGGPNRVFNLGTGRGHSVLEVSAAVEKVSGRRVPLRKGPRRAGDATRLVADPCKATAELGWRPRYQDLSMIVETAWNWHSKNVRQRVAVTA